VAKAAAGSPVAVGLSHPKGSSPFPLRHFLGERLLYSFVKGVGVRASLRFWRWITKAEDYAQND
jgi:hypothetical protein